MKDYLFQRILLLLVIGYFNFNNFGTFVQVKLKLIQDSNKSMNSRITLIKTNEILDVSINNAQLKLLKTVWLIITEINFTPPDFTNCDDDFLIY